MRKKGMIIFVVLVLLLTGCGKKEDGKVNIGIIQYIEHPALDLSKEGFVEAIEEANLDVNIDFQSAQGNIDMAKTIVDKFVLEEKDLIFAIATPAAETAKNASNTIPIVFTAVTDPVGAHLVQSLEKPGENATGTSDAIDVEEQLKLFQELDPKIKKIGVLYSADEANSLAQLEMVKKATANLNLSLETISIQNISDLPQAASSLVEKVEGLYVFSDNKVASSISLLTDIFNTHKIPSVCAEEAHVEGGGLISKGISYKDLGKQAGLMAVKILKEEENVENIPVEKAEEITKVVNKETVKALELNEEAAIFKDASWIE